MYSVIITEKGGSTERLEFNQDEVTIGRLKSNEIPLQKSNISKKHAQINYEGGRLIISDANSTNGTYVNGVRLEEATLIQEGDRVFIGDYIIEFDLSAQSKSMFGMPPPIPAVDEANAEASAEDAITEEPENDFEDNEETQHMPAASAEEIISEPKGFNPHEKEDDEEEWNDDWADDFTESKVVAKSELDEPLENNVASEPIEKSIEPNIKPDIEDDFEMPQPEPLQQVAAMDSEPQPMVNPVPLNLNIPNNNPVVQMAQPQQAQAPIAQASEQINHGNFNQQQHGQQAQQFGQAAALAQAPLSQEPAPLSVVKNDEIQIVLSEAILDPLEMVHCVFRQFSKPKAAIMMAVPAERCQEMVEDLLDQSVNWLIENNSITEDQGDELFQKAFPECFQLGPLSQWLKDDDISEIMINSADQVFIEKNGKLGLTNFKFSNEHALLGIIERIVYPLDRIIDTAEPMVDARLQDGSRVNAIIPPLAINGPSVTIRKFKKDPLTVKDLIKFGSLSEDMAEFLDICVKTHRNVIISGGTGSGKTTTLNVLSAFIPEEDRIVTVEDAAELQLKQTHVVRLESRPSSLDGKKPIHIRDLIKNSLRMRPDRIVVGECRGGEALDMLQAMNTGHDGSMTSLHANSPRDAMSRVETLVLMSGMDLPVRAIREQIASAVHIVVQQSRLGDGSRKITHISEIVGMEGEVISMQNIFTFKKTGYDEKGKIVGHFAPSGVRPRFYDELKSSKLKLSLEMFQFKK